MISIYCGKKCDNLPRFPLFTCTNMDTTKKPSYGVCLLKAVWVRVEKKTHCITA